MAVTTATTRDEPEQLRLGPVGWLRWAWRQLTSMRTALLLLLLLAVGAIPGSIFPQRGVDPGRVAKYLQDNPGPGPVLDRLGMFNVYGSPWFSAIYLLLFISLIGCVIPRTRAHLAAIRADPPRAPQRFTRMPAHGSAPIAADTGDALLTAGEQLLRRRRYRVRRIGDSVAAERGYLRETGNLVFHVALIGLLAAIAFGAFYGYRGSVVVPVGQGFANSLSRWDTADLGVRVDKDNLPPFQFTVNSLKVRFETDVPASSAQFAAPRDFTATVTVRDTPTSAPRTEVVQVNHPLRVQGVDLALAGNGYAPNIVVKDPNGVIVASGPVIFKAQDAFYLSTGVVKAGDTKPQLGLDALFAPSATEDSAGPRSVFPDLLNPRLFFTAFSGDLGIDDAPQNVFVLDTSKMKQLQVNGKPFVGSLAVGDSVKLPNGYTVTLAKVDRFAAFQISHDPAKGWALLFSGLAIAGLIASLFIPRRRVWLRVSEQGGESVLEVAALARSEDPRLSAEVAGILETLTSSKESKRGQPATG